MSQSRRENEGMTLIEVMIAMAILAIVSTLVYGGFAQTTRNKERIERQVDRSHEIVSGINRMVREIQAAYVSAQLNSNPSLQVMRSGFVGVDRGGGDRVDFTSFSHRRLYRDAHESDQNELSYFVTDHPDGGRKVLARRMQRRPDDEITRGGEVQILVDDVLDFELEYLDPDSRQWSTSWDARPAGREANRLPVQVKILLTVKNGPGGEERETYGTRVSIPLRFGLNAATYNP